ncbi:hypothetical protein N7478_010614 [Penicillium angulare]|uniref:uncharacterized protein n=1 Tax=Penicillium angulare TaxID=116970 RepID=UPI00253F6AC7|nr:uncharacterized protein N7478_010614 [Penicillium angulare]KAJ5267806.1 hypothetical protein N7478_010614 [Penicillium angulare]
MYQKCFPVTNACEEEFYQALGEKDAQIAGMQLEIQRLHADRAENAAKIQQQVVENERISSEARRLKNELHELHQQMNLMAANMQAQIQQQENQLASQHAIGEVAAANALLWSMVNNPVSGPQLPYVPESGLADGGWPDQSALDFPVHESFLQPQHSIDPNLT